LIKRKNKHTRFALLLIIGVIFAHSFAVLFSGTPVEAAGGITYKWNPTTGNKIDISGGNLAAGQSIVVSSDPKTPIKGTQSGLNVESTITYSVTNWIFFTNTYTEPCYLGVIFSFTSESSGIATLDTRPAVGNQGGPISCTSFDDTSTSSLFDNVSFQISGTRLGGANSAETDEQKGMAILVYAGDKKINETPASINVVVTGQASYTYNVPRGTYQPNNQEYYQWRTDNKWEPGNYHICIESTPSLNYPCQDFTKVKFEKGYVQFGQRIEQTERDEYRVVRVTVEISGTYRLCSAWRLDPLPLELRNEDGTVAKNIETDPFTNIVTDSCTFQNDIYATGSKYMYGNFNDVDAANYKVCVKDTNICKDFTKKEDNIALVTLSISGQEGQDILDTAYDPDKRQATTSCSVAGIGWLVCPVVTFLSKVADSMFSILADTFLRVNVSILNQDSSAGQTPVFNAWKAMQGIANVILIIMFLVIIFSQVSNIGISSYGLKTLAPKLIIAAILINLSFIICSIAVDVSNILGYSIRDFFDTLSTDAVAGSTVATVQGAGAVTNQSDQWATLSGGILAVVGVSVAGYFMLSMLGSLLIAALITLIVILLILVGRQAIIVLAIVLAPVAIAMWLLPNTEKLAKQWSKIFISMLVVFPIIALLFGACTFVSTVMTYSFNTIEGVNGQNNNWLGQIVAAGIQVIPLIATPFILQGILTSVPVIGAFAARMARRANGNLGAKASDSYNRSTFATARASRLEGRHRWQEQRVAERIAHGKGLTGLFTKGIGITKAQQYANRSVARSAITEAEEGESKDINAEQNALIAARIPLNGEPGKDMVHELHQAVAGGDTIRARAIQNIMLKTERGRESYYQAMEQIESDSDISEKKKEESYNAMRQNIKHNYPNIRSTDAAIEAFSNAPGGSLKEAQDHASTSGELDRLTDAELVNQHVKNVQKAIGLANDPARAQRMLDNPTLSGMNEKVRAYLQTIASRA